MCKRLTASLILCVAACAVLAVAGSPVLAGDLLTNRQLIASMPDDIESVLVLRKEPLLSLECGMKDSCKALFGVARVPVEGTDFRSRGIVASLGDHNLDRVVYCELIRRNPVVRLLGGSDFQSPRAFGMGSFRYVSMWVTEDSNLPVRETIELREGVVGPVTKTSVDGLDVYSSPIKLGWSSLETKLPEEQPVLIAFPTEHVTVIAMSASDLHYVCQALVAGADWMPSRWEAAASGIEVEAAMVMLRSYKNGEQTVTRRDPANYKRAMVTQVSIDSFALTSDAGPIVSFRLRVITSDPESAVRPFYGRTVYSGFPPLNWDWYRESDDAGFTADVTFKYRPGSQHHCSMIVFTLFGLEIAM